MSKVKVEKNGTVISVDSNALADHLRLGWIVKPVANDLTNVDITIGAQDGDVINVALQLQDDDGAALGESMSLIGYLSGTANGLAVTGTAPDGGVAAGTAGGCIALVAGKVFVLNTNTAGLVDINLTEAATGTWYLAVVFPNGERVVSDAITFV